MALLWHLSHHFVLLYVHDAISDGHIIYGSTTLLTNIYTDLILEITFFTCSYMQKCILILKNFFKYHFSSNRQIFASLQQKQLKWQKLALSSLFWLFLDIFEKSIGSLRPIPIPKKGRYRYFGTSLLCMFLFIFEQIVNNFLVCLWMKWSLLFDHIIIINIRRIISNKDYAYVTILLML